MPLLPRPPTVMVPLVIATAPVVDLAKMPLLPLVSVLPLVALRVKLPAVPSNVTPVTL